METSVKLLSTPELEALEKSKAAQIKATFEPMAAMLAKFEAAYNEIITESEKGITLDVSSKARNLRLKISRVRLETGKLKDREKAEYNRAGKAIQGVHNILVWAVTKKEAKLKEIENYLAIQEQKKIESLQLERAEILSQYVPNAHELKLGEMNNDVWTHYFAGKQKEYNDRIAADIAAEKERIQKRKTEIAKQKRIKEENRKLKAAIEEKERLAKIEDEKAEARLKAIQDESEKAERLEREKREKVEAELKAKIEAEELVEAEKQAKLQSELNRDDSDKVADLISDLKALKSKYQFSSNKNQKKYSMVKRSIDKIIYYIN